MFEADFVERGSLLVGRVRGVLDGAAVRKLVEFIELTEAEHETGFNRFADLTQLEGIHLSTDEIASLAARRRAYRPKTRVKSAFLVASALALGTVYIFKALLQSERIEVRWFDSLEAAAAWLRVNPKVLQQPKPTKGRK